MDHLVTSALDAVAGWGWPGLALVALVLGFGESALLLDLAVPGEVGMVFLGAATKRAGVSPVLVVAVGWVGAVAGDCTGYWVGRRWGPGVVDRWEWTRRRLGPHLERAQEYFERRGGPAVFAARWIGALRAVMPVVAGASRMPFGRFLAWDATAALAWVAVVVGLGYVFGDAIAGFVDRFQTALLIGLVVAVVAWLVVRQVRKRRRASG